MRDGGNQTREAHDAARHVEELATVVVDAAFHLHRDLGPGLLESVYERVLKKMIEARGYRVERQKGVSFAYHGIRFEDGLHVDLLVDGVLVIELKSVERIVPVHLKQLLTYLQLLDLPLGLLLNFGAATFRAGVKRVVNRHHAPHPSRLRVSNALPGADRDAS